MLLSDSRRGLRRERNCDGFLGLIVFCENLRCFRLFFLHTLVISLLGCNMGKESEPAVGPEEQIEDRLSVEDARQALIRMIEEDHQDDRLLQGALPYLRTLEAKPVKESVVKIGAWTCRLKEKSFTGDYASVEQRIIAQFDGEFVLDKAGQWKGVVTDSTRND